MINISKMDTVVFSFSKIYGLYIMNLYLHFKNRRKNKQYRALTIV